MAAPCLEAGTGERIGPRGSRAIGGEPDNSLPGGRPGGRIKSSLSGGSRAGFVRDRRGCGWGRLAAQRGGKGLPDLAEGSRPEAVGVPLDVVQIAGGQAKRGEDLG